MKNNFDGDEMKTIKTPSADYKLSADAEEILKSHKHTTKRAGEITVDDFLLDDFSDAEAPAAKPAPVKKEQPAPVKKEQPEQEDDSDQAEEETGDAGAAENAAEDADEDEPIIPRTEIVLPPTESKFHKKRLRKNLGLDDELTVVNGSHATTEKKEKKNLRTSYISAEDRKKRISSIVFSVLVLVGIYAGIFAVVNVMNKEYFTTVSESLTAAVLTKEPIINEEVYYIDSDKDGLSDVYEESVYKTDPNKADTDGDGLSDGDELRCGTDPLNPKTDGINADSNKACEKNLSYGSAGLSVNGKISDVSSIAMAEYKSLISQYPGVASALYEVTGVGGNCRLSIFVSDEEAAEWGSSPEKLSVFRMSTDNLSTERIDSTCTGGTLAADITKDGVYFAADSSVFSMDSGIDVMLLIDNSGSMYSASIVNNSEENDLDFKRVALSEDIIKLLDKNTDFGVGKFTATYTLLNGISDNPEDSVASLESIKNGSENFNGTEISGSIISAAESFTDNTRRRYIIMITDGLPSVEDAEKEQKAIEICIDKHISVIAISLGKKTDTDYLTEIAEKTDGTFYQAINTSSFDSIGEKIRNYMYIKRETVDSGDGTKVTLSNIADTGFSEKDCLAIGGVPSTISMLGSPVGSAVINKLYYSGKIPLARQNYNLVDSEFFIDGKGNLSLYDIPSIAIFNQYLAMPNKWNFRENSSMLQFTDKTNEWINENKLKTVMADYLGKTKRDDTIEILRTITFQTIPEFTTYQKAIIDVEVLPIPEKQIYYAASYYDKFSDKDTLSFGYNGDEAFALLTDEMSSGIPSVLIGEDNNIYNAVKLSRNAEKPGEYVVTGKNAANPTESVSIYLYRQSVLTPSGEVSQYIAKIIGSETKLYILNTSNY